MSKYNLKLVFDFLKSPNILQGEFKSSSYKYRMFFKLFFINLLIVALISIITGFLRLNFNITFRVIDKQVQIAWLLNLSMIPMLEEIAYRLPLFYNKKYLSLSFTAITYFIASMLFANGALDISTNILLRLVISIMIGITIYLVLNIKSVEHKISKFLEVHFIVMFYILILLFTLGHIENYNLSSMVLMLMPILLLPQFIGGIFLSFVRIKFGFGYAILFHILINVFSFSPQILMFLLSNRI